MATYLAYSSEYWVTGIYHQCKIDTFNFPKLYFYFKLCLCMCVCGFVYVYVGVHGALWSWIYRQF